jgi:hypothetical protein
MFTTEQMRSTEEILKPTWGLAGTMTGDMGPQLTGDSRLDTTFSTPSTR